MTHAVTRSAVIAALLLLAACTSDKNEQAADTLRTIPAPAPAVEPPAAHMAAEQTPQSAEFVRLRISDDGVGMSAEARAHLFSQHVAFDFERSRARKIRFPNHVAAQALEVRQAAIAGDQLIAQRVSELLPWLQAQHDPMPAMLSESVDMAPSLRVYSTGNSTRPSAFDDNERRRLA